MGSLFANDYREEYDYLLLNQPKASNLVISNDMFFKYTRSTCASSSCFTWKQPLDFTVKNSEKQWNSLDLNPKVYSLVMDKVTNSNCINVIDELKNCFCDNISDECSELGERNVYKHGLTASDVKSDIILYTDFWEKTTEIHYFAQNDFNLSASLIYYDYGKNPLSMDYTTRDNMFSNVGNDNLKQSLALFVNKDELYTANELGFFTPDVFVAKKWDHYNTQYGLTSTDNTILMGEGYLFDTSKQHNNIFDISKLKYDKCGLGYTEECQFNPYAVESDLINLETGCESYIPSSDSCHDYREDIFGNKYYLLKNYDYSFDAVDSRQRLYGGPVYVECVNGKTYDIKQLFFDKVVKIPATPMSTLATSLTSFDVYSGLIEAIDVFYDTLIISCASDCVGIFQIYMDYETGEPYITQDTSFFLPFASGVIRSKPVANRWAFDPIEKNIYFVHQPYETYKVNVYTYSLNDNKLTVDSNDFTNFIRPHSGAVAYNSTTRKLTFSVKGSTSSPSHTAPQYIAIIEYDKKGNSFIISDSLLISSTGLNGYADIIGSHLGSDNSKALIIEDHNTVPSKVYNIKIND